MKKMFIDLFSYVFGVFLGGGGRGSTDTQYFTLKL